MRTIVFYITGHGFGHASRVVEVINALLARRSDLNVIVKTTAAKWLLDLTIRGPYTYDRVETDTGLVQVDSLHLDQEASIRRAVEFMSTFDARVEREADSLKQSNVSLVVADMPPVGIAAAVGLGLPAIALGNFTWDWAYSAYSGSDALVDAIAGVYATADLAIRLPMWGGFGAFKKVVDVPFVARRSTRDPGEVRRALGVSEHTWLILPSFGGHGLEGLPAVASAKAGELKGYEVLFTFDEHKLYADGWRYEDLVRAADVVATKPGYGIIAECVANDTALLYTSRGHFIEYDVLVAALPRLLRSAFIDHADLFGGRWKPHLDNLLRQPKPKTRPATNGADAAADFVLELL